MTARFRRGSKIAKNDYSLSRVSVRPYFNERQHFVFSKELNNTTAIKYEYVVVVIIIIIIIISVMELGHLLTRSGLTYPEVSSKVCHDSFCQLENSVSLPWVIIHKVLYMHVSTMKASR